MSFDRQWRHKTLPFGSAHVPSPIQECCLAEFDVGEPRAQLIRIIGEHAPLDLGQNLT
jgi:hypothetical protein